MSEIRRTVEEVRKAGKHVATASESAKNAALEEFARRIEERTAALLARNSEDVRRAEQEGLKHALVDRLKLSDTKITQMTQSVRQVKALDDPAGRVLRRVLLDDGLVLEQITVPFGTVAAIVESRPDAVAQLMSLAVKSGNALVVKAGREVRATVAVVERLMREALTEQGLPETSVTVVQGREAVEEMLRMDDLIDLVIPRGSKELIRHVQENTRIPMIGHADGICHIYIDAEADRAMAMRIVLDAKTQAPSACNAVETVLIHRDAAEFLPPLVEALHAAGVKVRGCKKTVRMMSDSTMEVITDEQDWATEYGDLTVAMKIVDDVKEAIEHIERFGSRHTDSIVTENAATAGQFLREVDSAGVFHNASTRFADGFRYGMGAEAGISTGKLPPRGPVGLEGLVTYKWLLLGQGHCAGDYTGVGARQFKHRHI